MFTRLPCLALIAWIGFPLLCKAQASFSDSVVQVNGIVLTVDSLKPITGASIIIDGTRRGTQTNEKGAYGIVALLGQEILISHVGYKTQRLRVTVDWRDHPRNLVSIMEVDTQNLMETRVLITPTKGQFDHDFANAKVSDPVGQEVRKNLDPAVLRKLSRGVALSSGEATSKSLSAGASKAASANLVPAFLTTNLLDPLAPLRSAQ